MESMGVDPNAFAESMKGQNHKILRVRATTTGDFTSVTSSSGAAAALSTNTKKTLSASQSTSALARASKSTSGPGGLKADDVRKMSRSGSAGSIS